MRRAASGVGMCPSASQHDGTYRPLLDRMSRLGNESRSTFVAKASVLEHADDAVVYVSSEQEGHLVLALPVLATAAGTKSLLKLNDGPVAANLLTRHARCCSDKKSSTGLHDIVSTWRVWQWFSRCECCMCSVCLSSDLSESGKESHLSVVT
jgi:hypothetical protein